MIRIEQLTKRYGDTTVLNIPEMDIPKGQVFGLVGNNARTDCDDDDFGG